MDFGVGTTELCCTAALFATGILWNVFNLTISVLHWLKAGQPVDHIISCISISNVLLELSMFTFLVLLWADVMFSEEYFPIFKVMTFIWIHSNNMSFWSVAWLSVFYYVKVVGTSGALFVRLRRNISSLVNAALWLTVLCSFLVCFPLLFLQLPSFNGTANNDTQHSISDNQILHFPHWIDNNVYVIILMCVLCLVPLLVMVPCSLRLVVHLCQHTQAMRRNETGFQSADSYLLVCKLTVCLLVVYMSTVSVVLAFLIGWSPGKFKFVVYVWSLSFFCLATSVLLTFSNKQTKEKILSLCCCWRAARNSPDSREVRSETVAAQN
ncbi:taste receptor type 2 member 40-like [Megalops cyprinoides]|uniref:taste receptor type 2 member 40-like n=1 Tax=Megalops cyprinoides TaxID=118141 RepID=UPI001865022C|nr:taste receptor type 2 member 40-like [Megalops cyprinoides]